MANVFMDKESKKANVQLQLQGEVENNYSSGYDPSLSANDALKNSQALTDAAYTLTGDILNLYEDNKVNKLDADIRATWHQVEMDALSKPERFGSDEGIADIKKTRDEYKEAIDARILESNLSKKNRDDFLRANQDKQRGMELDLERSTIEFRMQREIENSTESQRVSLDSASISIAEPGENMFTLIKEEDNFIGSGKSSKFIISDKASGFIDKNTSSTIKTATLTNSPWMIGRSVVTGVMQPIEKSYSVSINDIEKRYAEGTKLTGTDLSKEIDTMRDNLDKVDDNANILADKFFESIKKNGGKIEEYEKEGVRLAIENNLVDYKEEKDLELLTIQKDFMERANTAINEKQQYDLTNPIEYQKETNEEVTKAKISQSQGDTSFALGLFVHDTTAPLTREQSEIVYINSNSPNRILNIPGQAEQYEEENKMMIESGDIKGLINRYNVYDIKRKKHIEDNKNKGRSEYLLGTDYDATFMERAGGKATGYNMTLNNLEDKELRLDLITLESQIKVADDQGFSPVQQKNLDINSLNDDDVIILSEYGIKTSADLEKYSSMMQKRYVGLQQKGDKPVVPPAILTDENTTAYDLAGFIKKNDPQSFLTKDNADVLDMFITTEAFPPSEINYELGESNMMSHRSLKFLSDKHSYLLQGDIGQKASKRGYIKDKEEFEKLKTEIYESGNIKLMKQNEDLTESMIDSLSVGLYSKEEQKEIVENAKLATSSENANYISIKDDRITNASLKELAKYTVSPMDLRSDGGNDIKRFENINETAKGLINETNLSGYNMTTYTSDSGNEAAVSRFVENTLVEAEEIQNITETKNEAVRTLLDDINIPANIKNYAEVLLLDEDFGDLSPDEMAREAVEMAYDYYIEEQKVIVAEGEAKIKAEGYDEDIDFTIDNEKEMQPPKKENKKVIDEDEPYEFSEDKKDRSKKDKEKVNEEYADYVNDKFSHMTTKARKAKIKRDIKNGNIEIPKEEVEEIDREKEAENKQRLEDKKIREEKRRIRERIPTDKNQKLLDEFTNNEKKYYDHLRLTQPYLTEDTVIKKVVKEINDEGGNIPARNYNEHLVDGRDKANTRDVLTLLLADEDVMGRNLQGTTRDTGQTALRVGEIVTNSALTAAISATWKIHKDYKMYETTNKLSLKRTNINKDIKNNIEVQKFHNTNEKYLSVSDKNRYYSFDGESLDSMKILQDGKVRYPALDEVYSKDIGKAFNSSDAIKNRLEAENAFLLKEVGILDKEAAKLVEKFPYLLKLFATGTAGMIGKFAGNTMEILNITKDFADSIGPVRGATNAIGQLFNVVEAGQAREVARVNWETNYSEMDDDLANSLFEKIAMTNNDNNEYLDHWSINRKIGTSKEYDISTYLDARSFAMNNMSDYARKGYSVDKVYSIIKNEMGTSEATNRFKFGKERMVRDILKKEGMTNSESAKIIGQMKSEGLIQ